MVDRSTVLHVAELAKIELREEEIEKFARDFKKILEFFDKLDEIDPDVPPTYHVLPLKNVFRKDEPKESLPRELVLMNAKHKEEGYFKGPKVVE